MNINLSWRNIKLNITTNINIVRWAVKIGILVINWYLFFLSCSVQTDIQYLCNVYLQRYLRFGRHQHYLFINCHLSVTLYDWMKVLPYIFFKLQPPKSYTKMCRNFLSSRGNFFLKKIEKWQNLIFKNYNVARVGRNFDDYPGLH